MGFFPLMKEVDVSTVVFGMPFQMGYPFLMVEFVVYYPELS